MNDIYLASGEKMAAYLDKAKKQLSLFSAASIEAIPRSKNSNANALAKLASTRDAVSVEFLAEPSIHLQQGIMELTQEPSWMDTIVAYLKTGKQLKGKTEARILWLKQLTMCSKMTSFTRRLLHATPKMCHPFRSKTHHKGDP